MKKKLPSRRLACVTFVGVLVLGATVLLQQRGSAQQKIRLNPAIALLEQGKPALMGESFIFIDMQHGVFSMDRLQSMITSTPEFKTRPEGGMEKAPIVRVPVGGEAIGPNAWMVDQVVERGAMGVIFPGVDNQRQAAEAVETMRDFDRAPRAWGIKDANKVHGKPDVWPLNPDGELMCIVIIESKEGVKNADAIAATPGVSAINIGPSDLSRSLGVHPPDFSTGTYAPEAEAAVQQVLKACKAHNVPCFLGGGSNVPKRLAEGFLMLFAPGARTM